MLRTMVKRAEARRAVRAASPYAALRKTFDQRAENLGVGRIKTGADAARVIRALAASGEMPLWDTPWGYGNWLNRGYLTPSVWFRLADARGRLNLETERKLYRVEFDTFGAEGIYVARGVHTIAFASKAAVHEYLSGFLPEVEYFSLNLAYASAHFARLSRPHVFYDRYERKLKGRGAEVRESGDAVFFLAAQTAGAASRHEPKDFIRWRLWAPIIDRWLTARRLRPNAENVARAMFDTQCVALFIAKLAPKDIVSYGGDSESGPLQEAEVYVKPCRLDCIEGAFVLSPSRLDAPLVSEAERERYCLSKYQRVLFDADATGGYGEAETFLHWKARADGAYIKQVVPVSTPAEAITSRHRGEDEDIAIPPADPQRWRWYRVI